MRTSDHFRINLFPKVEPQLREQRARYARLAVVILVCLLGLWVLADIAFALRGGNATSRYNFAFDAIGIPLMAAVSIVALFLIRRGRIVAAGYLLAASFFAVTTGTTLIFPGSLFLASVGYPLAVLTAGAIVGNAAPYPFALAGALALGIGWLHGNSAASPETNLYSTFLGIIFVVSQIAFYLGMAATLHSLSHQALEIQATLQDHTDRMTQLAHTDPLTGLANRRQLIDMLKREFTRARRYRRPLGLLYLDLDGFKAINDKFGHMYGDEILRNVANTMRAVLRSTDLLARIGGDEFAVLLPETPLSGVENVAAKLHRSLASYSHQLGPAVNPLTFCVGASQLHDEDASIDDILTRADNALLTAKSVAPGTTRAESQTEG
jgi:diguanylate cyclase (GGDEF)-like protein